MREASLLCAAALLFASGSIAAQQVTDIVARPVDAAPRTAAGVGALLRAGQPVALETLFALTSKSAAMGDMVPMQTAEAIMIDGVVMIPRGTSAMGQIEDARAKGVLGQRGKLTLRPLYIRLATQTVRLSGGSTADTGKVTAGAVAGLALVSPIFTGKSATLAAGTRVEARTMRDVVIAP
jgi:hypothetical protein